MEQNNLIQFDVICNEQDILEKILNWYNNTYKTDFEIVNWVGGELGFATIQTSKITSQRDIFNIGFQFGVLEEKMRANGEIDW